MIGQTELELIRGQKLSLSHQLPLQLCHFAQAHADASRVSRVIAGYYVEHAHHHGGAASDVIPEMLDLVQGHGRKAHTIATLGSASRKGL